MIDRENTQSAGVGARGAAGSRRALKVETKGIEPVLPEERHGRPSSVFSLWFGANVEFTTLVTGVLATSVYGLSFWQAFAAIVVGNLCGAALLAVMCGFGPRVGVPQLTQSRGPFGYYGNYVPGVLTFVSGFAWFAVNTVLGVYALQYLLGLGFGPSLAIMVIVQVAVAVYGHNLIHAIERWLMFGLAAVFIAVSVYGFAAAHIGQGFNAHAAGPLGFSGAFITTVAVTFSYTLGWTSIASDYTRYLPPRTRRRTVFGYAFAAMFVAGTWLETLGAALGTVANIAVPTNLVTHVLPAALSTITMIAFVLGTLTANVLNIYSGGMSALAINIPLRRWAAALLVGALGTAIAWFAGQHHYYTHFQHFLFLIGYWVAPWAAIMVADHFVVARGHPAVPTLYDRARRVRTGLPAWAVGVACSVPFMNQTAFTGPVAAHNPGIGDIAYFVGFFVAGACYLLLTALVPSRDTAAGPALPVGFQNSATGFDLGFYAARSYSLRRPLRTGWRLIRLLGDVGDEVVGPGRAEFAVAMGSPSVVVPGILGMTSRRCRSPKISIRSVTSVRVFTHAVPWMRHEACRPSGQILTTRVDHNGLRFERQSAGRMSGVRPGSRRAPTSRMYFATRLSCRAGMDAGAPCIRHTAPE